MSKVTPLRLETSKYCTWADMKLMLLCLLLVAPAFAAPEATLEAAGAFGKALEMELPTTASEKEGRERLVGMRIELEKIRRIVVSIERMWSFSRRASTSKDIVEANRLSTLNDLRTLAESSRSLVAQSRKVVLEPKRAQIEALFVSLSQSIGEYKEELQGGRYP